jgi:hypothetical protein
MARKRYAPGITYRQMTTLSFPVTVQINKPAARPSKEKTMSNLGAAEISDRVRRAVSDNRIPATEADYWTELLAENPSHAELLEVLVGGPEVAANRETIETALSAGPASVPKYTDMSAGDYRQHLPANAPKLFDNGDLPIMTASGIDVDLLRQIPWQARPAVARAKTYAEAHELVTKYSGILGQTQADFDAVSGGDLFGDVQEYEDRLEEWGTWQATDAEARQLTGGPSELIKKQWAQFSDSIKTRRAQGNPADHFPYDTDPLGVYRRR